MRSCHRERGGHTCIAQYFFAVALEGPRGDGSFIVFLEVDMHSILCSCKTVRFFREYWIPNISAHYQVCVFVAVGVHLRLSGPPGLRSFLTDSVQRCSLCHNRDPFKHLFSIHNDFFYPFLRMPSSSASYPSFYALAECMITDEMKQ